MRFSKEIIAGIIAIVVVVIFFVGWGEYFSKKNLTFEESVSNILPISVQKERDLRPFASSEEMKEYISRGDVQSGFMSPEMNTLSAGTGVSLDGPMKQRSIEDTGTHTASTTNVQVEGIDEPDMVKTDGKSLFVSQEFVPNIWYDGSVVRPMTEQKMVIDSVPSFRPQYSQSVRVVDAEDTSEIAKLPDRSGNLLLEEGMLVVLDPRGIFGYDVTDPKNPTKVWNMELKESDVVDARMMSGQLSVVARTSVQRDAPCPLVPLVYGGTEVTVACSDIYHPYAPVPASSVYTVMRVNPRTGRIEQKKSLVGSYDMAMTLFPGGLYTWYAEQENTLDVMYDFFRLNNTLISQSFFLRLEKLREYDISDQSKTQELFYEVQKYEATLDPDARMKFENDLENAMSKYLEGRRRELTKTHIFKLNTETLEVVESGYVPGTIKNQFSVDEFDGALRVAVTIGAYFGQFGNAPQEENDVYVLDNHLTVEGSVQGMGKGEQIYSTRFVGDRGYVVTFKQIDPFYVLDLGNPKSPQLKGELKIPGYSSYLHPLPNHRVLGIGKEGSKMKVTLFDVSNAENPKELSTNMMDEYWSDILSTHHALTIKEDEQIFFLPGSNGGYVFSYAGDTLKLMKAISGIQTRRAVYIDDVWYIVGDNGIVSYDEKSWKKVGEAKFSE